MFKDRYNNKIELNIKLEKGELEFDVIENNINLEDTLELKLSEDNKNE